METRKEASGTPAGVPAGAVWQDGLYELCGDGDGRADAALPAHAPKYAFREVWEAMEPRYGEAGAMDGCCPSESDLVDLAAAEDGPGPEPLAWRLPGRERG